MILSLAMIIASFLASEAIGNFFTLPEWMPTSVSSHDTIGSDPEDGSGWYLLEEVYTNSTPRFSEWMYSCEGQDVNEIVSGQIRYDDEVGLWVCDGISVDVESLVRKCYPSRTNDLSKLRGREIRDTGEESKDADEVYFDILIVFSGVDNIGATIDAKRKMKIEPVYWTNCVPRAVRADAVNQSAVNSAFEAYCERQYYSLCGQSNVWPVAVYGPRNNKRSFLFDPTTNGYEFVYYRRGTNACDRTCTTNRVISTRRLNEYDNEKDLAELMVEKLCGSGFVMIGATRPGWLWSYPEGLPDMTYYGAGTRGWWSSTSSFFEGGDIVNQFSWTPNPAKETWSTCSQALCLITNNPPGTAWEVGFADKPLGDLWFNLSAGWGVLDVAELIPEYVDGSMEDLLHLNYPHTDACGITNFTRRLLSKSLCNVDQVLGLMDRTLYYPPIYYPEEGSNFWFRNEGQIVGTYDVPIAFTNVELSGDKFVWESASLTNRSTAAHLHNDPDSIRFRTTSTDTRLQKDANGETLIHAFTESDIMTMVGATPESQEGDAKWVVFVSGATITSGRIDVNGTVNGEQFSISVDPTSTNVEVRANLLVGREYNHSRSFGPPTVGATQPGRDAIRDGVVKKMDFGTIYGCHVRKDDDMETTLYNMSFDDEYSDANYKGEQDSECDRGDIERKLTASEYVFFDKFRAEYRNDPMDWESIIPIDVDILDLAKRRFNVVLVPSVSLSGIGFITMQGTVTSVTIYVYGGKNEEHTYKHVESTGLVDGVAGGVTFAFKSSRETEKMILDGSETDIEDIRGCGLDGRIGIMQRTDWKWKSMIRTDE